MGCGASAGGAGANVSKSPSLGAGPPAAPKEEFKMIPDQFGSYAEVSKALRAAGLEASQLIVGVDFTKSNTWTGERSFDNKCLHDTEVTNPYQQVLAIIGQVLADFDEDNLIPAYGFGDMRTKAKSVFSFLPNDEPCQGLDKVLSAYVDVTAHVTLSGPTSFGPLIRQAIATVRKTCEFHILLIIADGQVDQVKDTVAAIVEASKYPLSIIMVGVGDGPWDLMEQFDDELPARKFDNFQFVDFGSVFAKYPQEKRDFAFGVHALMEVPDQYKIIKKFGMLQEEKVVCQKFTPPAELLGPPTLEARGSTMSLDADGPNPVRAGGPAAAPDPPRAQGGGPGVVPGGPP